MQFGRSHVDIDFNQSKKPKHFVVLGKVETKLKTLLKDFPHELIQRVENDVEKSRKGKSPSFCKSYENLEGTNFTVCLLSESEIKTRKQQKVFLRKNLIGVLKKIENSQEISLKLKLDKKNFESILRDFLALVHIAHWTFPKVSNEKKKLKKFSVVIDLDSAFAEKKKLKEIALEAESYAKSCHRLKSLAEAPSNVLDPKNYRRYLESYAKERGLEFEFWDSKRLKKENAGAFLAVLAADKHTHGGLVRITYNGGKKAKKKIALVGKGVCFDTGGYNIKTGNYMLGMQQDMTGSAVALASLDFAYMTKLDVNIELYLAIADNHISPSAYKMNDVVFASNGKSIEIIHTDAEGRMVLADTLVIASKNKVDFIIDYATLTGTCVSAVDSYRTGVFSNREELLEKSLKIARKSGELIWPFPTGQEYRKNLNSKVADLKQCLTKGAADHIYAATFLSEFVDPKIPWIHFDLSSHEHEGGLGLIPHAVTCFGVDWTMEFLRNF